MKNSIYQKVILENLEDPNKSGLNANEWSNWYELVMLALTVLMHHFWYLFQDPLLWKPSKFMIANSFSSQPYHELENHHFS